MSSKLVPVVLTIITSAVCIQVQPGIPKNILETWASKFGGPLFEFGRSVTKYNELEGRFHNAPKTSVTKLELNKLIREYSYEFGLVFKDKIEAVRKIMLTTEAAYESPHPPPPSTYLNAKKLNQGKPNPELLQHRIELKYSKHFNAFVNTSLSSVHVPTSIYEKDPKLLQGLSYTNQMDATFESNYLNSPTLSFQYFGSSAGFLRVFPATPFPVSNEKPDLYDCRTRPWYVGAANSPKHIFILQDVSGSMTGLRREISRHVVATILDTLTENDFVNVYNFTDECGPLVECFRGNMVQATPTNLHLLKSSLSQDHTSKVANFSKALHTAFEILQANGEEACNMALMIVTDGAPYNFEEIFSQRQNKEKFVRVFTYLIGRDVTDKREVMYMACANSGYYTHVTTLSEVQEQVLKHIPVLARPLVLHDKHVVNWSPVYADILDPTHTQYSWAEINAERQRRRSNLYKKYVALGYDQDDVEGLREFLDIDGGDVGRASHNYTFVITISIPVFGREKGGKHVLLGVAATDIDIKELAKIASPFRLGVGGYSYMINNNGHVIFHPEYRPVYNGLLRPNYNGVKLGELELVEDVGGFGEILHDMLTAPSGYDKKNKLLPLSSHTHLLILPQNHEYTRLNNTPYTLALSAPSLNFFHGELEIFLEKNDVTHYFKSSNWTVEQSWSYCEYVRGGVEFGSKEEGVLWFLRRIQEAKKAWKWKNTGVGVVRRHGHKMKDLGDVWECDKELMQSLVFDANVTEIFSESQLWKIDNKDKKLIELNGATTTFITTRSGLTRWIDFEKSPSPSNHPSTFSINSPHFISAIHSASPNSFHYSIPLNAGASNDTRVTATRAIFVTKDGLRAPVGVVGVQYRHRDFANNFFDITSSCVEGNKMESCKKTCGSPEYDCYVLDGGGFVIVSENYLEAGHFFGEIDGMVFEMLLNSFVYKETRVLHHQSVCFKEQSKTSSVSPLRTTFKFLLDLFTCFLCFIQSIVSQEYESLDIASINRTVLVPCDKETKLYTYGSAYNDFNFSYHGLLTKCGHQSGCDGWFNVHFIHYTNLILLVTDGRCRCGTNTTSIKLKEVQYEYEGECRADVAAHQKGFRVGGVGGCYNYNANEPTDCGGADSLKVGLIFIHTLFLLLL